MQRNVFNKINNFVCLFDTRMKHKFKTLNFQILIMRGLLGFPFGSEE